MFSTGIWQVLPTVTIPPPPTAIPPSNFVAFLPLSALRINRDCTLGMPKVLYIDALPIFTSPSSSVSSPDPHTTPRSNVPTNGIIPVNVAINTPAPLVLYTDLTGGPISGGENNNGAYLSIFGKNFGSGGLGTSTRVYIGGVEVATYISMGTCRARTDIQQIVVQVGGLGSPTLGTPIAINVAVNGVNSNLDQTFTPNPGRLLYVSLTGNDGTAVAGDITHPWRHMQLSSGTLTGVFATAQAGDIIVMRGGTWTDVGQGNWFVKFTNINGSAATGANATGPIAIIGYPGDGVSISQPTTVNGGFSSVDNSGGFTGGNFITMSNLGIDCGGPAGVINLQVESNNFRVVNCDLQASLANANSKAGGITGNGSNAYWFGNYIHNISGSTNQEMHGIYIDGDGSYEMGYNVIANVTGGNGMQQFNNGSNGPSTSTSNVHFHHNLVHDISKHGINIADGSLNGFQIYDNIVYNTTAAGIRWNTNTLHGCKVYNNTFYNTQTGGSNNGCVMNDWNFPSDALDMENNIIYPTNTRNYSGGSVGFGGTIGTVTNNLFFGGSGSTSFDAAPVSGDPKFASNGSDFHLSLGSAAIDVGSNTVTSLVTTDYDATTPRKIGSNVDIGAYEYHV